MFTVRTIRENIPAEELPFVVKWEMLQPYLSRVSGLNLSFFLPSGNLVTASEEVTPFCHQLASLNEVTSGSHDCPTNAFAYARKNAGIYYQCPHHCHYGIVKKEKENQLLNILILGPFHLGKRSSEEVYRTLCQEKKWDSERFCDLIRDLPTFTNQRIRNLLDFCHFLLHTLDGK